MSALPHRFLSIDEEGFVISGDIRWTEPTAGREILENLRLADNGALLSKSGDQDVIIEAFDAPLVAKQVNRENDNWTLLFPYEFTATFDPRQLKVDDWDRFHGLTDKGTPFVFSRSAQAQFFDLIDDSDDDSITIDGETFEIGPLFEESPIESAEAWDKLYRDNENGWDLNQPAEALKDMLQRVKLPKCRVLVPGCGYGHDAALFAQEGHIVTAIDLSDSAIAGAKERYGHLPNLRFEKADVFRLGSSHDGAYDLIFEHTLYCAIPPKRREDLVKKWNQYLAPGGQLMGVFFAMHKPFGPPFGGSEWELRERLRKYFRFLFWGRWQKSLPRRQGKELFVFATKL